MSNFEFYSEPFQTRMRNNYLAFFLKLMASRYLDENYPINYIKNSLYAMSLFGDWLQKMRISLTKVENRHIDEFGVFAQSNLPKRSKYIASTRKRMAKVAVSIIHEHFPPDLNKTPIQRELNRYEKYLYEVCELAHLTIKAHRKGINEFLNYFFPKGKISFRGIQPLQIMEFFRAIPKSKKNAKRRILRPIAKRYLRFLEIHGIPTKHLIAAIPLISVPRRASDPSLVTEKDLKKLLRSTNRSTGIGKRTYATILCLNDLGMRIGDVTRITFDDIDWRNGTIRIGNHKASIPFYLPLPKRVGEAIVAYIKDGRPVSNSRQIFLNHASHSGGAPANADILKAQIRMQWKIAGLFDKFSGTHIFRRSTATRLMKKGIPLKEIADFLGHQTIESTILYTQVDLPALRQVVQPWPQCGGVQ